MGQRDLVALQTLKFESTESAGFRDKDAGVFVDMPQWVQRAGPHRKIYFDPKHVTAAVVTCGGLCPGLNDVVQNIVLTLRSYGVPEEQILGIRYGLRGFYSTRRKPIVMDRHFIDGIHLRGGTVLGTSRGGADIKKIVHRIKLWELDMVFVIGGNGTLSLYSFLKPSSRQLVNACGVYTHALHVAWLQSTLAMRIARPCLAQSPGCRPLAVACKLSSVALCEFCKLLSATMWPAGGNAAANAIHEECSAQELPCSVVGVPKSIDNDIQIIDRCFGFESAVDEAQRALLAAKVEARSALRCVCAAAARAQGGDIAADLETARSAHCMSGTSCDNRRQ